MADVRAEAKARGHAHSRDRSRRPMSRGYDLVGLTGEWAFAQRYGYKVNLRRRRRGNAGVDFRTPAGVVDVKTARSPRWLWWEVSGASQTELLVLARFDDVTEEAELIGWEWAEELRRSGVARSRAGLLCYERAAYRLKSVGELDRLMAAAVLPVKLWEGPTAAWPSD